MSFNLVWSNDDKQAKGKAFVRKKLSNVNNNTLEEDSNTILKRSIKPNNNKNTPIKSGGVKKRPDHDSSINSKKQVGNIFDKNEKESNLTTVLRDTEKQSDDPTKLIKRKQKKDRIAAKQAAGEGNIPHNQSTNRNQTHSLFSVGHKDVYVKTNTKGRSVVEKVFSASKKFCDLEIHKYIVSNLEKIGYTTLTNVQEKSIPVILEGNNVLIRSQTGSGKTLAYAVPILDALQSLNPRLQRSDGVQAIIVVPTRELALQTHELFGKINTFQWIVVGHLCGGENRNTEKTRLRKGVHLLIATPGRLLDHLLHTAAFKINKVRCLVLDEADRLLDMGFKKDIVRIVEELNGSKTNSSYDPMAMLKGKHHTENEEEATEEQVESHSSFHLRNPLSDSRQTILLSATMTKGIAELADFTMKDHTYVDTLEEWSDKHPEMMVIPNTVKQKFLVTHVKHRLFNLSAMLISQEKRKSKVFVFMATSNMVDYHYELFTRYLVKMPKNRGKLMSGDVVLLDGMEEDSDEEEVVLDVEFFKLHGNMEQSARKDVFNRFRAAKTGVLLCTDVVSRGIDVPAADCIIQYNGPQSIEDYLHRVGRTGRAGKSGTSYIFLTHEEQDFVTKMEDHKIYLQKHDQDDFLKELSLLMEEPEQEKAATALQKRFENALQSDADLHKMACLAYSSWSRFYNTYPNKMRSIFDFKKANLGHYVTSFGLKETPTDVARMVRGQVKKVERPKLNRKLTIHEDEQPRRPQQKRKIKSLSLTTSEFSSGLQPKKKRKKKGNDIDD
ncbi:hypothetical protein JTB14_007007 [Gonioctena quinquepunctata]|nr:hypothetical protein JTB14_007007 [Gonioctena quinquepunctata]